MRIAFLFLMLVALVGARAEEAELRQRLADKLASPEGQLKLATPGGRLPANPVDRAAKLRAREASAPASPPPPAWGYVGDTGPERWASLSPAFRLCGQGTRQSPIDLRDTLKVEQEPIQFHYQTGLFTVTDTGRTLLITPEPGQHIVARGRRFQLMHIEARMPAETRINGQRFDMGLHLVHRDERGQFAIVAVQLQRGDSAQPALQRFWRHLPLEKQGVERASEPLDFQLLLPPEAQRGYFSFMGSITTPPCTEGVLWLVLREPLSATAQQLDVMRQLYPANARPVQPAGGRVIKESF